MEHLVNAEDSYAARRQLFKNIWDTAISIEDKDIDIMNKPKVIKTLRLDEVDRCAINKKKKQKLKNLRTVCNKILDFCDKQEADDIKYEKLKFQPHTTVQLQTIHIKPKKVKKTRFKSKVKNSRSLSSPTEDPAQAKLTSSARKDAPTDNKVKKTTLGQPSSSKAATNAIVSVLKASLVAD
ncbi:hypothetical protein evm_012454 [Chilo suppressalis]|nr:hypothetical protein evm_012454 [Chilo suppressalis]